MKLGNMANVLRAAGLTVVEIDGWQNRTATGGDMAEIRGVMWHHTATNRAAFANNDIPTLHTCLNGNGSTPGPLCQLMLGRTGIVYVLAAGVCYHAGHGAAAGIPVDTGNLYFIGIEMESSGVAPWDWTADQIRVAPHLGAALERAYLMHLPPELRAQIGHKEYAANRVPNISGKIDPAGWPGDMDGLRAEINKILDGKAPAPAPSKPAAPAPAPSPNKGPYVPDPHWLVDPGNTLSYISEETGYSVADLVKFNGIKNPNSIKAGERIWYPGTGSDTWMVDPGDTLSGISQWYAKKGHKVSVQQLQYANGINNPNTEVKVGMRLLIP